MKFEEFSGYILAGGKSSRMKRDKAFLKIGEKSFVENAFEILKPICENRIKIVLNNSQKHFLEKLPNQIPHIFDIYENRGALGGIHAGFKDCKTKFAIILAVDLPFASSEIIYKLCEIAIGSKDSAIVPKQDDQRLQPLAAIYYVEDCLKEIENILETESSASVRSFLEKVSIKTIKQKILSNKVNLFLNVNNPEDFANFDFSNSQN